ncbi:MAG: tRNA (5-methylaminomethyl-2-thiouridine)(34)-methyltransferase MnmD [Candidatus Woesearchaeota archaeon]
MTKIERVVTDDNSITYRNLEIDECYHTKSGALDESLRKHVIPSEILEKIKEKSEVNIADVCFGLGYNSLVAVSEILKIKSTCKINLFAFENDMDIMNELKNIDFEDENLEKIKKIFIKLIEHKIYQDENLNLKLFFGDFREEIKKVEDNIFDVVFFDAFSPQKMPELWSEDVFSIVYNKCAFGCVLTTYSCARMVRDNMKMAGFVVENGPTIGRRSPSTIARKN